MAANARHTGADEARPVIPAGLYQALVYARETLTTCAERDREAAMRYLDSLLDKVRL